MKSLGYLGMFGLGFIAGSTLGFVLGVIAALVTRQ